MIAQEISEPSQIGAMRRQAIRFAQTFGYSDDVLDRIGIVVNEAGTNLMRHASGGRMMVLEAHPGGGCHIVATDSGPGIASVEKALEDGFSTIGENNESMGVGLGAIQRQSDNLDIYSDAEGTTLVATFLPRRGAPLPPSTTAGIIVPKPGFSAGGDGWAARQVKDGQLVMLIDVLGHGPKAQDEAQKAIHAFHAAKDASLEAVEAAVAHALAGDRGAAVLIVEIGPPGKSLRAVGLGNIRGEIVVGSERRGIPSAPGISGSSARRPHPTEHDWPAGATLIMSTDGLRSTLRTPEPPALFHRPAIVTAATIFQRRRRSTDDSGIVVVKA